MGESRYAAAIGVAVAVGACVRLLHVAVSPHLLCMPDQGAMMHHLCARKKAIQSRILSRDPAHEAPLTLRMRGLRCAAGVLGAASDIWLAMDGTNSAPTRWIMLLIDGVPGLIAGEAAIAFAS